MQLPRLKEHRERALLTQAELATKSGVSEVTINRIEKNRHSPRFSTVRKLAQALGVESAELIGAGEFSNAPDTHTDRRE
jgi:transcriptional regulator with XRE-family HTH domain